MCFDKNRSIDIDPPYQNNRVHWIPCRVESQSNILMWVIQTANKYHLHVFSRFMNFLFFLFLYYIIYNWADRSSKLYLCLKNMLSSILKDFI
ncbi:hypothetical protein HZS_3548 [Henneguya salminicola]|nr:hypothetical protein HZS_3548 [Henneguya salminicola]